jgi:hypothetical protein
MRIRFRTAVVIAVYDDMTAEQPRANVIAHRRHSPVTTLDVQFLDSGVVEQGIPMGMVTDSSVLSRVRPLGINQYNAKNGANQAKQRPVFTPILRKRAGDGDVTGGSSQQTVSCAHCGIAQHEHVHHTRLSLLELSDGSSIIGVSSTSKRKLRKLGEARGVAVLFLKDPAPVF